MKLLNKKFINAKTRPQIKDRLFRSEVIERVTEDVSEKIKDPEIARMFSQCLPNTLDTTVYYREDKKGNPDTFVATGDIPAMWLRDSTNQVWPYLKYISKEEKLRKMFAGLINRQSLYVIADPYANSFFDTKSPKSLQNPWWPAGRHWNKEVWERKFEIDSLAAFMRLSAGYYLATKDISVFRGKWVSAMKKVIEVFRREQETLNRENAKKMFRFFMANGKNFPSVRMAGYGYPGRKCGLVRCLFRPSDDEGVFPYQIAANAMVTVTLKAIVPILEKLDEREISETVTSLANEIDAGIISEGIIDHKKYGKIYAYEVDGYGSACIMDDPNVPSLLSLPYLGYCSYSDPIYLATRKMVLGKDNPFYANGKVAFGLTSPHTGVINLFWPMATIMQALTSNDFGEILSCLHILKNSHAGTYFIHEGVDVDNPKKYTRPWFGWANSLFGELILHIVDKFPEILAKENI
ncbi:MAG: glycoside hydrolase family 125 protein [Patescibacteria group bacterium]|nr:glycoside hydrolase family 125 protein [Patescibacteria group bacterium]